MDFEPEDQEIIRLLTKIKDAEGEYPQHMLVARRRHFLRRIGEISLGIPADRVIKDAAKDVKPSHISPTTSALVETALVVAIIAEASTVAYYYRDRLADFFRRAVTEPRVLEVTPPAAVETLLEMQELTPSPALTVTVPSTTTWSPPTSTGIAVTPTGTPLPGLVPGVVDNINTVTPGEVNLLNETETPGPNNSSGNNGNNGNHYGQTPKPERTKENGNNPPPKDNDDKPPKEDKPPKDNNDKPPKDNNDKPPKD